MSILSMNKFVLAQKYTLCYYGNVVKKGGVRSHRVVDISY